MNAVWNTPACVLEIGAAVDRFCLIAINTFLSITRYSHLMAIQDNITFLII